MEKKKNPEVDINKKRNLFFFVGFVFALGMVLVAFEWKIFEQTKTELGQLNIQNEEEEMIPITQRKPPPPPPPPKQQVIEIVDDDEEIEEELEIESTEIDEDAMVEFEEMPEEEVVEEPEIFQVVEDPPEFPGGEEELFKYLGKSIQYPPMAKDAGVSGVVYVTFVVNEDGSISDVEVLRGIGAGCDKEAIRVVENMPKWKPGKQRGKSVKVQFNLPIRFTLR
ncbi:energy transducer TonB [Salibacter sp.]|uniref:energy transducer TonB n=1 Tax=Salibacter sp. TaxID=2010995 RepID=UPI002870728D|nr:energy transducer TonB [Salibacter sp.]MDR9398003.1 energy transducer TonB [Salibacter sp.]MDR9486869.1 energy transducer TonB [Salibacter sp.]